jgi:hypothetical protein
MLQMQLTYLLIFLAMVFQDYFLNRTYAVYLFSCDEMYDAKNLYF